MSQNMSLYSQAKVLNNIKIYMPSPDNLATDVMPAEPTGISGLLTYAFNLYAFFNTFLSYPAVSVWSVAGQQWPVARTWCWPQGAGILWSVRQRSVSAGWSEERARRHSGSPDGSQSTSRNTFCKDTFISYIVWVDLKISPRHPGPNHLVNHQCGLRVWGSVPSSDYSSKP